jgi:hypothetical protein
MASVAHSVPKSHNAIAIWQKSKKQRHRGSSLPTLYNFLPWAGCAPHKFAEELAHLRCRSNQPSSTPIPALERLGQEVSDIEVLGV